MPVSAQQRAWPLCSLYTALICQSQSCIAWPLTVSSAFPAGPCATFMLGCRRFPVAQAVIQTLLCLKDDLGTTVSAAKVAGL